MQRVLSATKVATLLGEGWERSPAYLGLAEGLRMLVVDGRIALGVRLPSERDLTAALGVSRTTVARAYALLREHGYLESRRGSGSVARLPGGRARTTDHLLSPSDDGSDDGGDNGGGGEDGAIDLTCAAAAAPPGVAAAYEAAVADLPSYLTGTGYFPSGLPALREQVARRYEERGLPTDPEQVLVVAGALAGVAIAARAVIGTGDRVLLETPTYPNAIATLRAEGGRLVTSGVDESGWDLDETAGVLRQASPTAAYLIPDFHNPTGMLLDDAGRERLGRMLTRARVTAIVDESLVETGLDVDRMPRPMAAYAPRTISVGSASKAIWGGLRIGWIRLPDRDVTAMVAARLSLDLGAPALEQLVLARLLADDPGVLEHRRSVLREARGELRAALAEHLPDWRYYDSPGGLSLWVRLPDPLSSALTASAERYGVALASGASFSADTRLERFLRLPYTRPSAQLTEAVRRLALAWADARHSTRTGPGRSPLVA